MSPPASPTIILRLAVPDASLPRFHAAYPEATFVVCPADAGIEAHLADASALVGGIQVSRAMLDAAPKLQWLQGLGVGIDGFLDPEIQARGITVTNGKGVNVSHLAEHAMAMILSFARNLPELQRRQARNEWAPYQTPLPGLFELDGQRLCLIGFGEIGRAIAKRAKAFDMEVWAMRRTPGAAAETGADRLFGPDGLDEMVAAADHLLLVAPLTAQTRGIIGADALARMKPSAHLYNMGRGPLVDHEALIAALREGRIAGAGLDVTDPEPLPATSPLWAMPNVTITGHTGGLTPNFMGRMLDFLVDNVARYRAGQPLRNTIDSEAGY